MKSLASVSTLSALFAVGWSSAAPAPVPQPASPAGASATVGWTTGSTGALGDVVYGPGEHVIDLANEGVYDAASWRVVFDFNTLTIESGATVRFANHPARAPVVFRALGDVLIRGALILDGENGRPRTSPPAYAEPGPGGFRGGRGSRLTWSGFSAGLGPGGGFLGSSSGTNGGGASHLSAGWGSGVALEGPVYGSPSAIPLIGGSGGASTNGAGPSASNGGAGAGGGAILIGSDTRVELTGTVTATGGVGQWNAPPPYNNTSGCGSGGVIRIVAPQVHHLDGGLLDARGGAGAVFGGDGGVRIEADGSGENLKLEGYVYPDPPSTAIVLGDFLPIHPRVALVAWWDPTASGGSGDWIPITQDPRARFFHPTEADVQLPEPMATTFRVEGTDVPLGAALHVRASLARGQAAIDSTHTMGEVMGSTQATSWTDVTIDLAQGVSAIQVRAELP